MAGLNQVMLIGNVGKDPEIRTLQNGGKVASFSIATSEQWRDKQSGERVEKTEWHNVVVFPPPNSDGLVGIVEQYVRKGSKVFVQGKMQTRSWEKDGVKRYSTEVVLSGFGANLQLLGDGGSRGTRSEDEYGTKGTQSTRGGGADFGSRSSLREEMDDEIPF